jgi:small subunit ribosomal protein S5e
MAAEIAENFETEDTGAQFVENVPPVVAAELPDIKLFGRWSCDEVQVSDMSLQVCILQKQTST